jgi:hypothetical protein
MPPSKKNMPPAGGMLGGMKPKPEPKGKRGPKPKVGPAISNGLAMAQDSEVEFLADEAQQQCQMDYARLCSSPSVYSNSWLRQNNMFNSPGKDDFVVDIMMIDEPVDVDMIEPCEETLEGGDDDANVLVTLNTPIVNYVQNMISGLRLTRPVPEAMPKSIPEPVNSDVSSRMLWSQGYALQDYDMIEPLNIGFGADGDMCLLDNYDKLSSSCQDSIDVLQMVQDGMYLDDEDQGCPLVPIILALLLLVLMLRCIVRRRMKNRKDSIQTTLAAIHASPELKAKVEAASGVPLPPTLPACRGRMAMAQKPWYVKGCCVLGVLVISFLIVISSMLITSIIFDIATDGYSEDASPVLVLGTFFAVLALELLLVKCLRCAICSYLNSSSTPPTVSSGTSSGGSDSSDRSAGTRSSIPQIFQRMRSVQVSSLFPVSFSRSSSTPSGPQYEPLLSEDEQEHDNSDVMMVPVQAASAPPANSGVVSTIPVVVTPIGYAPSNVQSTISML